MVDKELTSVDLPFKATVRYLGNQPSKGLWGIKHTRKPVDVLVSIAKNLPADKILPIVRLDITLQGLSFCDITSSKQKGETVEFTIDSISYGVQDLVYTRVFTIIVVTADDLKNGSPFVCHSFVCDSRAAARQVTYALAESFQDYGRRMKEQGTVKRFAIDLRTPEEQKEADEDDETEA